MTKNTKRGKHLPSVEFTLVHADGRFFNLTNDIGHRKVTVATGTKLDGGRVSSRYFHDRDSLREYVENRLNAAEEAGYIAV